MKLQPRSFSRGAPEFLATPLATTQGRRQKNFQGGGATEKRPKIAKKNENSTINLLQRGAMEKRPKDSIIKPLSTISVPCMKIQGSHAPPLPPAADAHATTYTLVQNCVHKIGYLITIFTLL